MVNTNPPDYTTDLRRQLGEFIRLHRQRIAPENVGFPAGGRRRTAGLRREELAQLCRVSVTWITWLEQGREVAASATMLARLTEALQLTNAERAYIRELLNELCEKSNAFYQCWQSQAVLEREGGERKFHHPHLGELIYEQLTMRPALHKDVKMVMLLPVA